MILVYAYHLSMNVQNSGENFVASSFGGGFVTMHFMRPKKPFESLNG